MTSRHPDSIPRLLAISAVAMSAIALFVAMLGYRTLAEFRSEMRAFMERTEERAASPPTSTPRPRAARRSSHPAEDPRHTALESAAIGKPPTSHEARQKSEAWVADTTREFSLEPMNTEWAANTEATLMDAASNEDAAEAVSQMRDFNAECRSRRCLVKATFASRGAALDWSTVFLLNADPIVRSRTQVMMNPDGSATIYVFGGS